MLQHTKLWFASTFDRPLLAALYVIAGLLAIAGAVFSQIMQPQFGWPTDIFAGFVGVYAVFFAALATLGYAVLFAYKSLSILWDEMGPVSQ